MTRSLATLVILAVGTGGATAATSAMSPARVIGQAKTQWLNKMRASAENGDRSASFPSPPRALLLQRLHKAERLYGFRIVSAKMFHPLQAAPAIVVSSNNEQSIARATPRIVDLFDPHHATKANPSGCAYEGYFFVAQTTSGAPYLATFNECRAPHIGGGEWAANESLYPFPHG